MIKTGDMSQICAWCGKPGAPNIYCDGNGPKNGQPYHKGCRGKRAEALRAERQAKREQSA